MLGVVLTPTLQGVRPCNGTGPCLPPETRLVPGPQQALGVRLALRVMVTGEGVRALQPSDL